MPCCPRCTGFLPPGATACPHCGATFAALEAASERPAPLRVADIEDPDARRSWSWRATEVGFAVTTLLCLAVGGYGLYVEWFEGSTQGGNWLLPLFIILGSPLLGMMGGAACGTLTVIAEPLLRLVARRGQPRETTHES